jgi:pimeloyl-[acyl-carrier protein] methyl ester esterase
MTCARPPSSSAWCGRRRWAQSVSDCAASRPMRPECISYCSPGWTGPGDCLGHSSASSRPDWRRQSLPIPATGHAATRNSWPSSRPQSPTGVFLILGESFSGPLALLLAARRPRGLRGVILCATFACSPLPSFARWLRYLIRSFWFRAVPWSLIRRGLLGRFETKSLGRIFEGALAAVEPSVLAARARAVLAVDVGAQLRSCPVPILYLAATEDRLVSRRSLAHIRRLQPRVDAVALVGPHLLLQVAPEMAARVIHTFAASCRSLNEEDGGT